MARVLCWSRVFSLKQKKKHFAFVSLQRHCEQQKLPHIVEPPPVLAYRFATHFDEKYYEVIKVEVKKQTLLSDKRGGSLA